MVVTWHLLLFSARIRIDQLQSFMMAGFYLDNIDWVFHLYSNRLEFQLSENVLKFASACFLPRWRTRTLSDASGALTVDAVTSSLYVAVLLHQFNNLMLWWTNSTNHRFISDSITPTATWRRQMVRLMFVWSESSCAPAVCDIRVIMGICWYMSGV